ncbi:MAG: hypothetical protein KIS94_05985 [Chitinophagales bacterium]|nr:hypothetical protein [Chitinophagales bacterium]
MRLLFLLFFVPCFLLAQSNRTIAIQQIADLKSGALIVRLKTNDKSVEAYRRNGRNDVADRIIADRKIQNQKIVDAFRSRFDFCKVYFIYASSTNQVLEGTTGLFLNDAMEPDTSIVIKESYFLLAEYGTVTANMRGDEYHYKNVDKTEASSNTTTSSAIFISDTSLTQLKEPFPFYQTVLLENYTKAVDRLNSALHRFYFNRVSNAKPTDKQKK